MTKKMMWLAFMMLTGWVLWAWMLAYALVAQANDDWNKASFYLIFSVLMWLIAGDYETRFDKAADKLLRGDQERNSMNKERNYKGPSE